MLKVGVYSSTTTSGNEAENDKARGKLFVENIENIISSHTSDSRLQYPTTINQAPD